MYEAVHTLLEEINIGRIKPTDPLASGVLDLTMFGDTYMDQLPKDVLELLSVSDFLKEVDLPQMAQDLLNEFVASYEHLEPDFGLSDMDGISFPAGIKDPQLRKDMGMIWGVLDGL